MSTRDQTPTFNLKAVLQETGLKADTLRAWERRYGLPQPKRTLGRHRLYSQQDIDTLKWLIARQEEGLSISRAVALWRQIEAEGQDPLQAPGYAIAEDTALPTFVSPGDTIVELRQAWISACKAFNEQTAEQVLAQAFALYPPETACFELLQKGLAKIGDEWYRGQVTVQQEHFASSLALRHLEAMVAASPPPTRTGRILIGCAPEEAHTFAPLLLTFLLKRRGWNVVYLGARVPTTRLQETITAIQPHLVILTAQLLHTAATLMEAAQLIQGEKVALAYGGMIFNLLPALRERIHGHFLGERLELAIQAAEQLLLSPPPPPTVKPVSDTYRQALAHYGQRQTLLEADIWKTIESLGMSSAHLTLANEKLAQNIIAALKLGDMKLLDADIDWIEGLLTNHQIPTQVLRQYLDTYYAVAKTHLDENGKPILDWLNQLV